MGARPSPQKRIKQKYFDRVKTRDWWFFGVPGSLSRVSWKLSRTVLRGGTNSNVGPLLDQRTARAVAPKAQVGTILIEERPPCSSAALP
jgi:hypothetical protein